MNKFFYHGPLKNKNNELITDPKQQATLLNEFFSSVFTRSSLPPPVKQKMHGVKELRDFQIDIAKVKNKIDDLKEQAAPGPDGISSKVLKKLCDVIALPLSILFRKSLDEGKIPDDWRDSNVSPI